MHITVVALDNPYPPDYGGAIDLYYKLEALANAGAAIDLYYYHKPHRAAVSPALRQVVIRATPLPRQAKVRHLLNRQLPYFVASRPAAPLLQALAQQPAPWRNSPILWDGLHTAAALPVLKQQQPRRRHVLRAHNCEEHYYAELAATESNPLKRQYFRDEVRLLRRYEPQTIALFQAVLSISTAEVGHFAVANRHTAFLPAFLPSGIAPPPDDSAAPLPVTARPYRLLYHANFAIGPNAHAARHLVQHILPRLPQAHYRLKLAGRDADTLNLPDDPQLDIIPNPTDADMARLLAQADLCVLPARQSAGVKLKYLTTLRAGRPAITTPEGAAGSGLEAQAVDYHTDDELIERLAQARTGLLTTAFARQQQAFDVLYNPTQQAHTLLAHLANHYDWPEMP